MKSLKHKNAIVLALVIIFLVSVVSWVNKTQNLNMWTSAQNDIVPEINISPEVGTSTDFGSLENEWTDTEMKTSPVIKNPPPVKVVEPLTPVEKSGCYVGGCSSQVCSDSKDILTTCEWREEYVCYQKATCEKQTDGQCGWSDTPELKSCLIEKDVAQAY